MWVEEAGVSCGGRVECGHWVDADEREEEGEGEGGKY